MLLPASTRCILSCSLDLYILFDSIALVASTVHHILRAGLLAASSAFRHGFTASFCTRSHGFVGRCIKMVLAVALRLVLYREATRYSDDVRGMCFVRSCMLDNLGWRCSSLTASYCSSSPSAAARSTLSIALRNVTRTRGWQQFEPYER